MAIDFERQINEQHQEVVRLTRQGKYEHALDLASRTHDEVCDYWQTPHFRRAHSLHLLAELHRTMGRYAEAERFYLQALGVYQALHVPTDPDTAGRLHDLACFLADEGGYSVEVDDPLYQNAYQLFLSTQSEEFPCYTSSQYGLSCVYAATGRLPEARSLMRQAAAGDEVLIGQVLALESEAHRANFLRTAWARFAVFISLVYRFFRHSAADVRAALELSWRRKAIGAEALTAQRVAVLSGRHPSLVPLFRELNTLRGWIAKKTLEGPGPEGSAGHLECLQRWQTERYWIERRLARQTPEIRLQEGFRAARLQTVGRAVPPGTSLIEYVRLPLLFDFLALRGRGKSYAQSVHYLAFVTSGPSDEPSLIDLGEAEPLDRLVNAFRAGVTGEAGLRGLSREPCQQDVGADDDSGQRLRAAVFDPLAGALGAGRRLLLAPDGDLNQMPFEALPLGDGRHLLDPYRMSYVTVGRDVLRFRARSGRPPGEPLVAADPDFDLGVGADTPTPAAPVPFRLSRDLDSNRYHFARLPGTCAEGECVAGRLGVQPLLAGAALEGRLKTCRSPRILHLATHGFFLPDQPRYLNQFGRNLELLGGGSEPGFGRLSGPGMESPMLRSGLALAGANTFLRGAALPTEAEDGLLTAEDVTGLDLLDTELVVLSACETGLGAVHAGEGVFGLRRAFIVAGARTLVMSLWKVPDLATAFLMDRFYDNLLTRGLDRDLALRDAQRATRDATIAQLKAEWLAPAMIERFAAGDAETRRSLEALAAKPDDHKPFEPPFFWGAFICQGDPSPLPPTKTVGAPAPQAGA
jgi:CHAT domain-containing protein